MCDMNENWALLVSTMHARTNLVATVLALMGASDANPPQLVYI